jgi:hypothetical protein
MVFMAVTNAACRDLVCNTQVQMRQHLARETPSVITLSTTATKTAADCSSIVSHLAHVWPHEWVLLPAGSDQGPYVVRHGLGPGGTVPLGNLGRIAAGRKTDTGTAPQA